MIILFIIKDNIKRFCTLNKISERPMTKCLPILVRPTAVTRIKLHLTSVFLCLWAEYNGYFLSLNCCWLTKLLEILIWYLVRFLSKSLYWQTEKSPREDMKTFLESFKVFAYLNESDELFITVKLLNWQNIYSIMLTVQPYLPKIVDILCYYLQPGAIEKNMKKNVDHSETLPLTRFLESKSKRKQHTNQSK